MKNNRYILILLLLTWSGFVFGDKKCVDAWGDFEKSSGKFDIESPEKWIKFSKGNCLNDAFIYSQAAWINLQVDLNEEALKLFDLSLKYLGKDSVSLLFGRAKSLMMMYEQEGRHEKELGKSIDYIGQKFPVSFESYALQGKYYFIKKDFMKAKEYFEKAIVIKEDYPTYRDLVVILEQLGDFKGSINYLGLMTIKIRSMKHDEVESIYKDLSLMYSAMLAFSALGDEKGVVNLMALIFKYSPSEKNSERLNIFTQEIKNRLAEKGNYKGHSL
jgi:tetratricopeptide (TPR) repeat protein